MTTREREREKERALFKSTHEFCPRRTARRRRRACPGNQGFRWACRQILEGVLLRQPFLFLFVSISRSDKTCSKKKAKNVKKVGDWVVPLLSFIFL